MSILRNGYVTMSNLGVMGYDIALLSQVPFFKKKTACDYRDSGLDTPHAGRYKQNDYIYAEYDVLSYRYQ